MPDPSEFFFSSSFTRIFSVVSTAHTTPRVGCPFQCVRRHGDEFTAAGLLHQPIVEDTPTEFCQARKEERSRDSSDDSAFIFSSDETLGNCMVAHPCFHAIDGTIF